MMGIVADEEQLMAVLYEEGGLVACVCVVDLLFALIPVSF
jgi:hypothetical protein